MRTPVDAVRSIKKHVALTCGDAWEVRLWADDVRSSFPMARVGTTGNVIYTGSPMLPDATLPLSVYAYTEPKENVADGLIEAGAAEQLLFEAFRGWVGPARPLRIPLYNYDGVPVEGEDSGSDDRWEHDFLRVTDLNIGHVHDPTDDRFIVVTADVRVTWRRAIPGPLYINTGNLVQSLHIEFDAQP
jgi:hypothetical protein